MKKEKKDKQNKEKKQSVWLDFKVFLEPLFSHRKNLIKIILSTTVHALFPIVTVRFIDMILLDLKAGGSEITRYWLLAYVIFILIYHAYQYLGRYNDWYFRNSTAQYLAKKYISEYIHMNANYTESIGTGKRIGILHSGMLKREMLIREFVRTGYKNAVALLFALVYIASVIGRYLLMLLAVLFLMVSGVIYFNKMSLIYRRRARDAVYDHLRSFVKILMTKREILQTAGTEKEIKKINQIQERRFSHQLETVDYVRAIFLTSLGSFSIITAMILIYYSYSIIKTGRGYEQLVTIMLVITIAKGQANNLANFYRKFMEDRTSVEKILNMCRQAPQIQMKKNAPPYVFKKADIEIRDLGFSYDEKNQVFSGLTMKLRGGQKTALVGPSGGGKSTLLKLIAGYMSPQHGSVFVDNQDLQELSLLSYYRHIAYLTQEPSVFDGTIRENLCYGSLKQPSKKQIEEAIAASQCDFVYDFNDGLETEIGERGIRLSGGQRQRLAIAKIFLKNPEIVLLDEPTSALDSFSEEAVTVAMNNLFEGRTVIIIAHRLQTVKSADDIIVIGAGSDGCSIIEERGTHDELVKKGGHYAKMLELQSGF